MTDPVRRIAFVGNVANGPYRTATAMRADGIDAHLFVDARATPLEFPERDGKELDRSWVHVDRWITPMSVLWPAHSELVRQLRAFDLVIATGPGPIYAQFADRPWCFFVSGGDLTVKPFPFTFLDLYPNWPHRAAEVVAGAWQRRAVRRADQLWMQPFAPMVDAADRLGIDEARRFDLYIPVLIDTEVFRPDVPLVPEAKAYAASGTAGADFVVFHPSRLLMDRSKKQVRTGQWKGNDVLIRAFATFVASGACDRPLLVLPDSPHSRDLDKAKLLVEELQIGDYVWWAKPPDGRTFDRSHMIALYASADIGVDEFGVGWFGSVALETLAMGIPCLTYVDDRVMTQMYDDPHPMVVARTEEEVAERLVWLAANPDERHRIGATSRSWLVRNHAPDVVLARYRRAMDAALSAVG